VTQTNVGGRSTFQNAGATRRRGLEASWSRQFAFNLHAEAAWTWLDARYRDAFKTCTATPCAVPNVTIPAGNRIPGIPRSALYGALGWGPVSGWRGGVEARALSRVWVNDPNSDAAAGYATVSAYGGYTTRIGAWELGGFARVDNIAARRYAGSVIVNEGNSRFFEPAPGRTWTAGINAAIAFR
jgi:iron complex outermembrane receptor protein